ncbi:MAG TPA: alkaline phosphatase [Candidatus Hydrogenedentes bacterium]|nr:alkaline phosphatase [Candidatus Hydrogenedentota bacterium]HOL75830.1 alkaline phosphatase [Candidatus Hydrogenedentota bacterium]HPO86331.1 alkaline phosphatase [Candidatus Hydrogenedentota bacterium]
MKTIKSFALLRGSRGLFAALCVLAVSVSAVAQQHTTKHIILFIGDGMQLMHEIAASRYLTGEDEKLSFHSFPHKACVATWDTSTYDAYAWWLNVPRYDEKSYDPLVGYNPQMGGKEPFPHDTSGSPAYFLTPLFPYGTTEGKPGVPATDSASSGTAMATGHKTEDGRISWTAEPKEDGKLTTIAERMRAEKGAAIGVVSTVPFNHATPAVFVAHNVSRGNVYTGKGGYEGLGIADEIIKETKPDVVIGAGHPLWDNPDFNPKKGYLSKNLYDTLKSSTEYVFVERQAGVNGGEALAEGAKRAVAEKKKLFGLFGGALNCFDPAIPEDSPGAPKVVPGSTENPTLAQAALAAITVLQENESGFFLMCEQGDIDWANHIHHYSWMIGAVWDLSEAVKAVKEYIDKPGDSLDWDNTLLLVTADHANSFMRLVPDKRLGKGDLPRQESVSAKEGEGSKGFSYPDGEVTYGVFGHTNELVSLYGMGADASLIDSYAGTEYPGTRILNNTQIFKLMAESVGLK